MKVMSWNVNGIRAVEKKGNIQEFIETHGPDVLFLQETKARPEQLSEWLVENPDYQQHYHAAQKPGYSGVSVWLRVGIEAKVETGMAGWEDVEGRVISAQIGDHLFFGVYFPNGGKSPEAWQEKLRFYDHFHKHIAKLRKKNLRVAFTGDLNVAHREIDLARPKDNEKTVGFRPEERAWVDRLVADQWVDVFRTRYPDTVSYTWWDQLSRARERNVGWRIDSFFVDAPLYPSVKNVFHLNDFQGSDHCPIGMEIDL